MQTNRFNISTTYYTPDQWSKLSAAQRAQVLNARGTKRNISAMESSMDGAPYHDDDYVNDYYEDNNLVFVSPDDATMEVTRNIDAVTMDYADVAQSQLSTLVLKMTLVLMRVTNLVNAHVLTCLTTILECLNRHLVRLL